MVCINFFVNVFVQVLGSTTLQSAQLVVSDRFRPLALPKLDGSDNNNHPIEAVLPGIFFVYELSPFMIQAERRGMSFLHLMTKLCAIGGGIFSVMGIFDGMVFRVGKMFKK
ncbi:hypothetical protein EON65_10760 [archaeon]|nr:MAG: hypothetical protein EON65_10760 [archaeon]